MELSKKNLKELATKLGAYQLGGNIYDYTNCLQVINQISVYNDTNEVIDKINEFIKNNELKTKLINCVNWDLNVEVVDRIATSENEYTTIAQINKVNVYENDGFNFIKTFYVYFYK